MVYVPQIQRYQTKALFATTGSSFDDQTHVGAIAQVSRVTDVSFSVPYPLVQNVYLNGASESANMTPTPVNVTMKWAHTNAQNEVLLGLASPQPPSGTLGFDLDESKNLYISIENQYGVDAIGASGANQTKTVIGLGQALMTSYGLNASVGSIINAEASFACLSSFIYSGNTNNRVPTVNYQDGSQLTGLFALPAASSQYNPTFTGLNTGQTNNVSAIAANDLIMLFPQGSPYGVVFTGYQGCYLQSMSVNLSFDRREIKSLGYAYPPRRSILYPMRVDVTTNAVVNQYQADQLSRFNCVGATGQSVYIIVKQPCSNATLFGLYFTELQVDSQDFTTSVGRNDTVSIKWRGIISNYAQTFFDPTVNYLVNLDNGQPYGVNW